ncbi:hypothetical protein CHUAL_001913 [Chamberlinius hualienensis]
MRFRHITVDGIFVAAVCLAVSIYPVLSLDNTINITSIAMTGSNVTLECKHQNSGTHGNLWMKGLDILAFANMVFSPNKRIELSNQSSTLTIRNVTLADEGKYTCVSYPMQKLVYYLQVKEFNCEVPEVPMYGGYERSNVVTDEKTKFTIGQTIKYFCFNGYQLKGVTSSKCTVDGWTDTVPICEPEFVEILRKNLNILGGKLSEIEERLSTLENLTASRLMADETSITDLENSYKRLEEIESNINTTIGKKMTAYDVRLSTIINQSCIDIRKSILNSSIARLTTKDGNSLLEFTWVIENIEEKIAQRQVKKISFLKSKDFYTNIPGYRMELEMYLDDRDSGYFGLYMILVQGQFDDIVEWPFHNKYNFTMVSEDDDALLSYQINPKTTSCSNTTFNQPPLNNVSGCGISKVIKIATILANKPKYIKNGAVTFTFSMYL